MQGLVLQNVYFFQEKVLNCDFLRKWNDWGSLKLSLQIGILRNKVWRLKQVMSLSCEMAGTMTAGETPVLRVCESMTCHPDLDYPFSPCIIKTILLSSGILFICVVVFY